MCCSPSADPSSRVWCTQSFNKATFTRDRVFRPGLDARRKMASSARLRVYTAKIEARPGTQHLLLKSGPSDSERDFSLHVVKHGVW